MDNYIVYRHINKTNGKVYIGMTLQKVENRWKSGGGYHSRDFSEDIKKYGWDGFTHDVIANGLSKEDASELERILIKSFKSNDPKYGYNRTKGGDTGGMLGHNQSQAVKQQISKALKSRAFSEEHKKHISESKTGVKHHLAKKVYQYAKDGTFIREWDYMAHASKELKINKGNIGETCNGHRKSAGGFIWKYERM